MTGFGRKVVLDNSAWSRLLGGRLPAGIQSHWESAVDRDEILVCDPFRLEALYSARDGREYETLREELDAFAQVSCDEQVWRHALNAQATLAQRARVSHRVKPVDLLVAAIAHHHRAGVLHYDHDFDALSEHAGLTFDSVWLAPRGSLR